MLARALIIAATLVGLYFLTRRLRRSLGGVNLSRAVLAVGAAGFLLLLTVRGGIEMALPLLAVLVPFLLRWLHVLSPSSTSRGKDSSQQSAVRTRFLYMTLDHASGVMVGQVQEGCFAGRALHDLTLSELLMLWRECQVDSQSVAVLESYLDRHAESMWRERLRDTGDRESPGSPGIMSQAEAYQILGLPPGAARVDIQSAYRRLIQRVHPDQGGSAYLAAQLNQARDLLLGSK
ncbi:MAG TPA: DnaJ domain-containing protein [Candidatus Competibacteraceae bacterium]|nr:DnaJ domain-containing protein [Candidatus Competibacteraceae bacterium]